MEIKRFSIFATFKHAFKTMIDNVGLVAVGMLAYAGIMLLLLAVLGLINMTLVKEIFQHLPNLKGCLWTRCTLTEEQLSPIMMILKGHLFASISSGIMFSFFAYWLQFGYTNYSLHVHDNNAARITDLLPDITKLLKFMAASMLFILIFLGGLILLVIPGFYFLLRFMFFPYVILTHNAGVVESLKSSWHMTRGYGWELLGYFILLIIISTVLGWIPFGFLLYWPFSSLASVCAYRQLSSNHLEQLEPKAE
ncbi:MAG: hypothetical protein NTX86_01090 [Candidatus Dependentiae bacterium]|nr:hypothetical protein [Candidatus Dependentiae bacterium]